MERQDHPPTATETAYSQAVAIARAAANPYRCTSCGQASFAASTDADGLCPWLPRRAGQGRPPELRARRHRGRLVMSHKSEAGPLRKRCKQCRVMIAAEHLDDAGLCQSCVVQLPLVEVKKP